MNTSSNVLLVDRVLVVGEALRYHTFQVVIVNINLKDEFLLSSGHSWSLWTYQSVTVRGYFHGTSPSVVYGQSFQHNARSQANRY